MVENILRKGGWVTSRRYDSYDINGAEVGRSPRQLLTFLRIQGPGEAGSDIYDITVNVRDGKWHDGNCP